MLTTMNRTSPWDHGTQREANYRSAYYDNNHQGQGQGHYQQDGYYDERGQQGYQDEYYNDQYYDQGGAQGGYGQNGYGFVSHIGIMQPCQLTILQRQASSSGSRL